MPRQTYSKQWRLACQVDMLDMLGSNDEQQKPTLANTMALFILFLSFLD